MLVVFRLSGCRLTRARPQEHLSRLRLECDRRCARAASLLEAKDPDLRMYGVPSVAACVDVPEAHALDAAVAAAEAAAVTSARAILDPATEARARAAIDERAVLQARAAVAGFGAFTGRLAAALDAGRQTELAERAAARLKEAEAAGEEGKVDEAQRLMEEAEQLKRVAAQPPPKPPGTELVRARRGARGACASGELSRAAGRHLLPSAGGAVAPGGSGESHRCARPARPPAHSARARAGRGGGLDTAAAAARDSTACFCMPASRRARPGFQHAPPEAPPGRV